MKPSTLLLRELSDLAPLVDRLRAEGLRRRNLTLPRLRLLMHLHEAGPLRSSELAQRIGVTPRAVTALVDGLEDSGYVVRQPDTTDRRAMFVELTAKGTETGRDLQRSYDRFANEVLGGLDDAEIETALRAVQQARQNIEGHLAQ